MSSEPPYPRVRVCGLILAGGRARRMGGRDKGLLHFNGRPLVEHGIAALQPQCHALAISTNNPDAFSNHDLPAISDEDSDYSGPVAGILAGMEWAAAQRPEVQWLLTAPVVCPFLPADFAARLWQAVHSSGKRLALARSADRTHFVCGLWNITLRQQIRALLVDRNIRRAAAA